MVLIPAGSFLMGSTKDEVDRAIKDCVKELGTDQQTCAGWYKRELLNTGSRWVPSTSIRTR